MEKHKRVIIDYKKLTPELLKMLVEKYPDGYGDTDIIHFRTTTGEYIEAVEVATEDHKYLIKVSTRLAQNIANFDENEDTDCYKEGAYELPDKDFLNTTED